MSSYKLVRRSLAVALIAALAAVMPALASQPEDAWITTKVKMKLLTAERIDPFQINVDTFDGHVTLHGHVGSEDLKQQAESLAAGIDGVREVRNLLAVVPAAAQDAVAASDDELRGRIETVLERDQALGKSSIRVKSVNDGIVVLSGEAATLSAHRRALEDARSVDGVRSVASEVRSPDELADRELWSEPDPEGSGLGSAASDGWITAKAKIRLMAEPGISPLSVNVDTRDGVVTLFGAVSSEQKKQAAEREVGQIAGVKGVDNELQVVPDVAAERIGAQDDQLVEAIQQRLAEHEALRDADISVEVTKGVVRLTGTVGSFGDKMTALTVARTTEGVDSIVDDLQVQERKGG
jgi:osmotically-inducible protein OsmY